MEKKVVAKREMAKKGTAKTLEHAKSAQIVEAAVRQTSRMASFSFSVPLAEVLPTPELREVLRANIRNGVRTAGIGIKAKSIPLEPHFTIDHIVSAVTGLAGDPSIDDD